MFFKLYFYRHPPQKTAKQQQQQKQKHYTIATESYNLASRQKSTNKANNKILKKNKKQKQRWHNDIPLY